MKSAVLFSAALASLAAAAPTKRQAGLTDAQILNYALTLEHLENAFYRDGLAQFTAADFVAAGFTATTYDRFQRVAGDEATHVAFISGALTSAGYTPVQECTYNFGVTDVASFVATASVLEGVGVSAYTGAAADIMSKNTLTAAGSVLAVEARHSSYIREALGQVPFAQPFDNPLRYNEVYTLAAAFIVSCPATNPELPVRAFPSLSASAAAPITTGTTVDLATVGFEVVVPAGTQVYGAFITVTGATFVDAVAVAGGFQVVVPAGIAGQSYVVLTSCNVAVTDETIIAGPAIIEVA